MVSRSLHTGGHARPLQTRSPWDSLTLAGGIPTPRLSLAGDSLFNSQKKPPVIPRPAPLARGPGSRPVLPAVTRSNKTHPRTVRRGRMTKPPGIGADPTCCTPSNLGKRPRKKFRKNFRPTVNKTTKTPGFDPVSSAPRTRLHPARPGTIHLQHPVRYAGHRTQTTTTDDTTPSDMPARQKTHTLRVRSENRQTAPTQPPNTSPTFSEVLHSAEAIDRTDRTTRHATRYDRHTRRAPRRHRQGRRRRRQAEAGRPQADQRGAGRHAATCRPGKTPQRALQGHRGGG